ncbi:hypothetical protein CBR_g29930 [Chara braunii]|uniref:Uncharacterized protein n=1 Tax=Chara braunii TaxID=69332 RepID=A0A388JX59_CHABU|nr:hypothetical protein CBR_g29930 [Chara braunii]|eukprot:GBG62322.1 hypothetical protein CBR_g29930 [Chara braunii]
MASTEDLQRWADAWLAELEDGELQMQEILRVMSSPSNHPLQGQGGESLMVDWMEDKIQQMLEIIWAFEEGPDPGLDDFIDGERKRGIVSRCYDLFWKAQTLSDSYCVNDSEGDMTTSTISTVTTGLGENVGDSVVNGDKRVEEVSTDIGCDDNMIWGYITAGGEEEGDDCVDNDNNNNNDNNDINDKTFTNKISNRGDSCDNNDASIDNNNKDNVNNNNDNISNNINTNNQFKNTEYSVLGDNGIDNNNSVVGSDGDADDSSTNNIDDNGNDGFGWDDMEDMRINCGCSGMIGVVSWQRMGVG